MRRLLLPVVASFAFLAAGCGDDGGGGPTSGECRDAEGGEVTIVAEKIAWDVDCLRAPAGEPLTIVVDNRDDGVNHNIAFNDSPGEPATKLESGPVTQELTVDLPAGEHEFVCDIHPNMVGTLHLTEA